MVIRSPVFRLSRASSAGSTAAPNAPSLLRQQNRQRPVGIGHHLAEQRIGVIHRFDFHQGHLAAAGARHGAHGGGLRHGAVCVQEGALGVARLPLNEREGEVAAEDDLSGTGNAVGKACGHRADAGDGHHAERDTGDENREAAHSRRAARARRNAAP